MENLKNVFVELINKYNNDKPLIEKLWHEIETNHSDPNRHYHTLSHLENLYAQLLEVNTEIKNWDAILCCLFYHDIVYDILRNDNEAQSAAFARKRLNGMDVPLNVIEPCCEQILATQSHLKSEDTDTNYFLDADLSILGFEEGLYLQYAQQIRLEYNHYPDEVYNPGRIKVLEHFLGMEYIYKTEYFRSKYEQQAKRNLELEHSLIKSKL